MRKEESKIIPRPLYWETRRMVVACTGLGVRGRWRVSALGISGCGCLDVSWIPASRPLDGQTGGLWAMVVVVVVGALII